MMCLFECTECGHRFIDALNLSQAWFDKYYLTQYTTDDKPYSDERLNKLADCVMSYGIECVLDVGGMDFELIKRFILKDIHARPKGIGDLFLTRYYDAVILSHTLEHVYNIAEMFNFIQKAVSERGVLFVEIPIYLNYGSPIEYDYHWQHINKFRPQDIERLCTQKGFTIVESKQIEDYREYKVWRLVGRYAGR